MKYEAMLWHGEMTQGCFLISTKSLSQIYPFIHFSRVSFSVSSQNIDLADQCPLPDI